MVGVDCDEYYTTFANGWPGRNKLITSALKRVDVGVSTAISNFMANPQTGFGTNLMLNATNGGVGFAEAHETSANAPYFGPVTAEVTAAAVEVQTAMARGNFDTSTTSRPMDQNLMMLILVIAIAVVLVFCLCVCICCMAKKEKAGKPVFSSVEKPAGGTQMNAA